MALSGTGRTTEALSSPMGVSSRRFSPAALLRHQPSQPLELVEQQPEHAVSPGEGWGEAPLFSPLSSPAVRPAAT